MAKILFIDNDDSCSRKITDALLHEAVATGSFLWDVAERYPAEFNGSVASATPEHAIKCLHENHDFHAIILGNDVSQSDGLYFLKELRKKYNKNEISAIVIVEQEDVQSPLKYIEAGASDFIRMPFSPEELCFRIAQNEALLPKYSGNGSSNNADHLTQLSNRRYFYKIAEKLFANSERGHIHLTSAMIDIDHFSFLNDAYGEKTGDLIIQHVAEILHQRFRKTDVLTRYGGKKFCVLNINLERSFAFSLFDNLRKKIEQTPFEAAGETLKVTISTGVYTMEAVSLKEMIRKAGVLLQTAIKDGGNRVLVD